MGSCLSSSKAPVAEDPLKEVDFYSFNLLRAIGRGAFGKVCIVEKKDSKKQFAMKYMAKDICIQSGCVKNVIRELELLKKLSHTFIVNLWFSFQDDEDLFIVLDLMLGGDLRHHLTQKVRFNEKMVKLYIAECGSALDYMRTINVVHRDIKPDNILLDENGHAHLTDFNVAVLLEEGKMAHGASGTRPYMAPEVFRCYIDETSVYSYPVDWWSLGITAYELLRYKRPFEIHSDTSTHAVLEHFNKPLEVSTHWSHDFADLLVRMMAINPDKRLSTLDQLRAHPAFKDMNFEEVLRKEAKPLFVPKKNELHCDPAYELEEMIVEARPLYAKKPKNKNKKPSKKGQVTPENPSDPFQVGLKRLEKDFVIFNRLREQGPLTRMHASRPDVVPNTSVNGATSTSAECDTNKTLRTIVQDAPSTGPPLNAITPVKEESTNNTTTANGK